MEMLLIEGVQQPMMDEFITVTKTILNSIK